MIEEISISKYNLEDLESVLRGELITREDENYVIEKQVYNAMIDKNPALIIKCRDVADVVHAVNFGSQFRERKRFTDRSSRWWT
ncbi:MAG: hypothetical protein P8X57_16565 [Cyclobacteriaceae bacterium]